MERTELERQEILRKIQWLSTEIRKEIDHVTSLKNIKDSTPICKSAIYEDLARVSLEMKAELDKIEDLDYKGLQDLFFFLSQERFNVRAYVNYFAN